jgi:hypothetical protein
MNDYGVLVPILEANIGSIILIGTFIILGIIARFGLPKLLENFGSILKNNNDDLKECIEKLSTAVDKNSSGLEAIAIDVANLKEATHIMNLEVQRRIFLDINVPPDERAIAYFRYKKNSFSTELDKEWEAFKAEKWEEIKVVQGLFDRGVDI